MLTRSWDWQMMALVPAVEEPAAVVQEVDPVEGRVVEVVAAPARSCCPLAAPCLVIDTETEHLEAMQERCD